MPSRTVKPLAPLDKKLADDNARVDAVLESLGPPVTKVPAAKTRSQSRKPSRASGLPELPATAAEKRKTRHVSPR